MTPKGIIVRSSPYTVRETIDRIVVDLTEHDATIYARIDQQAEARKAGQPLRPLQFLLFGNPKAGTPLIAQTPMIALDLPLKVIAWEDEQNQVWIAYNEASYLEERYFMQPVLNSALLLDPLINRILKSGA